MNTFIRAVEHWIPSEDGSILEFGAGLYGANPYLAAVSRELCFGRGEGLPGHAWEAGHPIVLKKFEGSYFRRTAAAHAAGIHCGIAIPIFSGETLKSVVVIFCGEGTAEAGAIELWHSNPALSADLSQVDGHYGNTASVFESVSCSTTFRHGTGLPGKAAATHKPAFLSSLDGSSGFVRTSDAQDVGINRGLALPCSTTDGQIYVLTLLSAQATPIARRVEIWEPDGTGKSLSLVAGFCEVQNILGAGTPMPPVASGEDPIGQVMATQTPVMRNTVQDKSQKSPAGGPLVALPVLHQGRLMAGVALYL